MGNITDLLNKWKYLYSNVGNIDFDLCRVIREVEEACPYHDKKIIGYLATRIYQGYGARWEIHGQKNLNESDFDSISDVYFSDNIEAHYPVVIVGGSSYLIKTFGETNFCRAKLGLEPAEKPTKIPLWWNHHTMLEWARFYDLKIKIVKEGKWRGSCNAGEHVDYTVAEFV